MRVPCAQGDHRRRPARRGQGPQNAGGHGTQTATRPPRESGAPHGPACPTHPGPDRRAVRPPASVRAARPDARAEPHPGATHAGTAAPAHPAADDGPDLSLVRPPLPQRDRAGQTGPVAWAGATLQKGRAYAHQAVLAESGESIDVSRRRAVAVDVQRGGTRQSPSSEDAENRLLRANRPCLAGTDCPGHAPRPAGPSPLQRPAHTAYGAGRSPLTCGNYATDSDFQTIRTLSPSSWVSMRFKGRW